MRAAVLLLFSVVLVSAMAAAQSAETLPEPAERIVAVVDDDPVLQSDLDARVALGVVEKLPGESDRDHERRVLDLVIEDKLRFHEIDRFGLVDVPEDTIEEQFQLIKSRLGSGGAFGAALERLGLTEDGLRRMVARQLGVVVFVDERLGPRIFVTIDEIDEYYNNELTPRLEALGQEAPPVATVREDIRALLREERLNEELDIWTEELRSQAEVLDYFDRTETDLPPVVSRKSE